MSTATHALAEDGEYALEGPKPHVAGEYCDLKGGQDDVVEPGHDGGETHHMADDGYELLDDLNGASVDGVALGHVNLLHFAHEVRQYLRAQTSEITRGG